MYSVTSKDEALLSALPMYLWQKIVSQRGAPFQSISKLRDCYSWTDKRLSCIETGDVAILTLLCLLSWGRSCILAENMNPSVFLMVLCALRAHGVAPPTIQLPTTALFPRCLTDSSPCRPRR